MRPSNIIGISALVSGIALTTYGGFNTASESNESFSIKMVDNENLSDATFTELYSEVKRLDSLTNNIWDKLNEFPDSASAYKQELTEINSRRLNIITSGKYVEAKEKNGPVKIEHNIGNILLGILITSLSGAYLMANRDYL